jgi:hypothetical protein
MQGLLLIQVTFTNQFVSTTCEKCIIVAKFTHTVKLYIKGSEVN